MITIPNLPLQTRFDLKNAPDGTPVPHSSAGELFDEGLGVDRTEGRGTVEPDGESSGASDLLQDERRKDIFGSVSIPKFRFKKKNIEHVKTFTDVEASTRLPLRPSCRSRLGSNHGRRRWLRISICRHFQCRPMLILGRCGLFLIFDNLF